MACQHCCEHRRIDMVGGVPHCQDCHKTWAERPTIGCVPTVWPMVQTNYPHPPKIWC